MTSPTYENIILVISSTSMTTRSYIKPVSYDDIYVIGGIDSNGGSNTLTHFSGGKWTNREPLLNSRYCHANLVQNNCIYVYGGANHYRVALKPDCYNINNKAWSSIDTDVFNYVILNNCVYNEHVVYLFIVLKIIYILCLYDNTKTFLYTNV